MYCSELRPLVAACTVKLQLLFMVYDTEIITKREAVVDQCGSSANELKEKSFNQSFKVCFNCFVLDKGIRGVLRCTNNGSKYFIPSVAAFATVI